ncbi:MAG TPA: metal-sensitive transcriptional regulator [Firmicutes bacterium]|nr:metal-sensitive transcriptional regulator [Bacillota bacterium]
MPEDNKEKLLLRLKTAAGHLKGIEKMVQEDRYCVDVLQQLNAVISSLHKISELVLEKHLHSCVRAAVKKGDDEKILQELMEVFKYRGC